MATKIKLNSAISVLVAILSVILGFFLGSLFLKLDIASNVILFSSVFAACLVGYLLGKITK